MLSGAHREDRSYFRAEALKCLAGCGSLYKTDQPAKNGGTQREGERRFIRNSGVGYCKGLLTSWIGVLEWYRFCETARTNAYHLALKDVGPFIVIEQDANPRGRICSRRGAIEVIHK